MSNDKEQERILSANKAPLYDAPENRKDDQFWSLCLALEAARKALVAPKVRILSNVDFNPPKQIDWLAGYDSDDYRRRDRQPWEEYADQLSYAIEIFEDSD